MVDKLTFFVIILNSSLVLKRRFFYFLLFQKNCLQLQLINARPQNLSSRVILGVVPCLQVSFCSAVINKLWQSDKLGGKRASFCQYFPHNGDQFQNSFVSMLICLKPKRESAPAKWCICRLARKKSIGRRHTVVKSDHSKDYDVILLLNTDVFTLCSLVRFSFFSLADFLLVQQNITTIIRTKIDHYSNVPK